MQADLHSPTALSLFVEKSNPTMYVTVNKKPRTRSATLQYFRPRDVNIARYWGNERVYVLVDFLLCSDEFSQFGGLCIVSSCVKMINVTCNVWQKLQTIINYITAMSKHLSALKKEVSYFDRYQPCQDM